MRDKQEIRVAILDLYNGMENEGMRCFEDIVSRYKEKNQLNLTYKLFDVRKKCEVPHYHDFDIYLMSGGPGSPLDTEGMEWEKKFFTLIDQLEEHNLSANTKKKHAFFVCHSFQLMCRRYKLGKINTRHSPSFGILPVHFVGNATAEPIFAGLSDPFYAVDSRSWQVIDADHSRFAELGMELLAIEKERPHVKMPRALMAIRYSEHFFGTQFHPEADAQGIKNLLLQEDRKREVIHEHGINKYNEMIERLEDPDKITHTQNTIIPNFLDQAVLNLHPTLP